MNIFIHWLVATLAVIIAAFLLPGVILQGFFAAFVTALVLGILNLFIKPLLVILTLPINILTLGLFTIIINAALVMLASGIVPGFKVETFGWAILFAIILGVINLFFGLQKAEAVKE